MKKKPTGKRTFWKITKEGSKVHSSIEHLDFPDSKNDIERLIMSIFCKQLALNKFFKILSEPLKISDHDIDFRINTSLGEVGVELVEDAPLTKEGYKNLKSEYSAAERYDHVKGLIQTKSKKYESYDKTKIKALIIYNTDGKLGLIESITALVIKYCHMHTMVFDYIFYLDPRPDLSAIIDLFYPQEKDIVDAINSYDDAVLRNDGYIKIL